MKRLTGNPADTRVIVTTSCSVCGKTEKLVIDQLDDYAYVEDILDELGWRNHVCPSCLRKQRDDTNNR